AGRAQGTAETALYFSRVGQAQREFEAARTPAAERLLARYGPPAAGGPDRRGWGGRHLRHTFAASLLSPSAGDWAWAVTFSPDGGLLAAGCSSPAGPGKRPRGAVALWDARTGEPAGSLAGHDGPVVHLDFSRDGRRLATAGLDGKARVWDVASRKELL